MQAHALMKNAVNTAHEAVFTVCRTTGRTIIGCFSLFAETPTLLQLETPVYLLQ